MPVASLQDMAIALCKKHIHDIDDLGEMPYKTVEPILRHITSPDQLLEIQAKSPHLAEHTEALWIAFIKRDVPSWEKNRVVPKNKALWSKVYRKVKKEDDDLKEKQHQDLKKAMMEHASSNFNEGFRILPGLLVSADNSSRRGVIKKPAGMRRPNGGVSKYAGPGATSAAMQNFRKETAKFLRTHGPIHAPRGLMTSKELTQIQNVAGHTSRNARGTESYAVQGARKLDEYLRRNQAELEQRNERLKQLRASRFDHKHSPNTSPPLKPNSPIRPPRSSSNSPSSSTAGSAKSTPALKPTGADPPVPQLDLAAQASVKPSSAIATAASPSRKMSLQAYTMRRKASSSIESAAKRPKIN